VPNCKESFLRKGYFMVKNCKFPPREAEKGALAAQGGSLRHASSRAVLQRQVAAQGSHPPAAGHGQRARRPRSARR
jgi:hypothetical protein